MARTATGIDVGTRTAVVIRGQFKGNTFHATGFAVAPIDGGDPAAAYASLAPSLRASGFKPQNSRVAVSGRDVNVRYTRVPEVPDWQLRNLMRFEVQEIGDQSGSEVASDFNLLPRPPEISGEDVVLLAMARESLPQAADYDAIESDWAGLRPMTPWSSPIIRHAGEGLVLNIGHGMLGWTLAMGSGERTAELVVER